MNIVNILSKIDWSSASGFFRTALFDTLKLWSDYFFQAIIFGFIFIIVFLITSKIKRQQHGSLLCIFLFGTYCYYIFAIAFLCREAGSYQKVNLTLFSTFTNSYSRKYAIENMIMMFPLGILLPTISKLGKKWYTGLFTGFAVATFIEIVQLVTQSGYFEIDDILFNGLGEIAGWIISMLIYGILTAYNRLRYGYKRGRRTKHR